MSDTTTPPSESSDSAPEILPGRGHTVTRTINGKPVQIPWGFTDFRTEGKAAKAVGIAYPATSRKAD